MDAHDPELDAIRQRKMAELNQPSTSAPATGKPMTVTDSDFDAIVAAHKMVLVDVWAPWCGPCRALHPILDEVAREMAGELVIAKLNSDENQRTAFRFNVMAIPTMLLFKDGELVAQAAGVAPKAAIKNWVQEHAAAG